MCRLWREVWRFISNSPALQGLAQISGGPSEVGQEEVDDVMDTYERSHQTTLKVQNQLRCVNNLL